MIKLNKREETNLLSYLLDSDEAKTYAIRDINSFNMPMSYESKLKLTQAVLDGKWEVEEPLYYVHLMSYDDGYLNIGKHSGVKVLSTKYESETHKTKFTRAEVKAIDPRYLEFLEEVE